MNKAKLRPGERIYPVCKKVFYAEDIVYWAYKIKSRDALRLACTWTCLEKLRSKVKPMGKYNSIVRKQGA